jgi:drug/metabolite transporter (DMT)-like permease
MTLTDRATWRGWFGLVAIVCGNLLAVYGFEKKPVGNEVVVGTLLFWAGVWATISRWRIRRKMAELDYQARAIAQHAGQRS